MNQSEQLADALRDVFAPGTNLVHPTYRHLQRPVTLAGLNRAQWLLVTLGLLGTWAASTLLPLPTEWALSSAGTVIGCPCALLFLAAAGGESGARAVARGVLAWRRQAGVRLPAPTTTSPRGYELSEPDVAPVHTATTATTDHRLEDLWVS